MNKKNYLKINWENGFELKVKNAYLEIRKETIDEFGAYFFVSGEPYDPDDEEIEYSSAMIDIEGVGIEPLIWFKKEDFTNGTINLIIPDEFEKEKDFIFINLYTSSHRTIYKSSLQIKNEDNSKILYFNGQDEYGNKIESVAKLEIKNKIK